MFIHIGDNIAIPLKGIVGVFDLEGTTITGSTRDFLKIAEEEGFVTTVSGKMPRSFIVSEQNKQSAVYVTPISVSTIKKRINFWFTNNNKEL